jgi:hypothetical protein
MPGNPRAIIEEAELRFPVRIVVKVPEGGIPQLSGIHNRLMARASK